MWKRVVLPVFQRSGCLCLQCRSLRQHNPFLQLSSVFLKIIGPTRVISFSKLYHNTTANFNSTSEVCIAAMLVLMLIGTSCWIILNNSLSILIYSKTPLQFFLCYVVFNIRISNEEMKISRGQQ
jgi:hypothetical protein